MKTSIGIIGSGPAGLILSEYLRLSGIDSVVLERSSREHVEQRQRAGVLEPGTADMLLELGAGNRMLEEGMVHNGFNIVFDNRVHHVDLKALSGKPVTVYPQTKLTQDLIASRLQHGGDIIFNAENVQPHNIESDNPKITFENDSYAFELECDYIADCGGWFSPSRALYNNVIGGHETKYDMAWLGILAPVEPLSYEITYVQSPQGFALFSMRSEDISRYYLQCDVKDKMDQWPAERIWSELQLRLGSTELGPLNGKDAPFLAEPEIFPMSSYIADTMQVGKRLFLAGDAAHKVPPTGAKGLNMAAYDAHVLAQAFIEKYKNNNESLLSEYSNKCLKRASQVLKFSSGMTHLLHQNTVQDFRSQTEILSKLASNPDHEFNRILANNYVGKFDI